MEKMDMYTDKLFDKFTKQMIEGFLLRTKDVGSDVWPSPRVHPLEAGIYAAVPFFERIEETLHFLEKSEFTDKKIAELFIMPSRIVRLTYLTMGYNLMGIPPKRKTWVIGKLLNYISLLRKDTFCESGKNIIWEHETLKENFKKLNIFYDDSDVLDVFIQFNYLLSSYCELVYFSEKQIGHEDHGPYEIAPNKYLIVRDFYDLKPPFWKFSKKVPFDRLQLFIFINNENIRFDFSNRWYGSKSLRESVYRFGVIDYQQKLSLPLNKLQKYVEVMKDIISEGIIEVDACGKSELINKFGEKYFYAIKPLRDIMEEDWKPPEKFYASIKEERLKNLVVEFFKLMQGKIDLSIEERKKRFKMLVDPRANVPPIGGENK